MNLIFISINTKNMNRDIILKRDCINIIYFSISVKNISN